MKTKSEQPGTSTCPDKETEEPLITDVSINAHLLTVTLNDGRIVSTPVAWYPRLRDAAPKQRANWRIIADGIGVHWPDVDEDLSLDGMLAGRVSIDLIKEQNKVSVA